MATIENSQADKPDVSTVDESDQKETITDPYREIDSVFGPYVRFIESWLQEEEPEPARPVFEKAYTVRPLSEWDEKKSGDYEYGNRIVAPEKDFQLLLSKGADTPIILQLLNPLIPTKVSHCSVIEWTAPENTIYVPSWMLFDFGLQTASSDPSKLLLRLYAKPFLKGSFIQIQPYKSATLDSDEFQEVQHFLELSLKKYQCVTIGDTLWFKHKDNVHLFQVTDVLSAQSIAGVTPFDVVSLINTDVSVDFLPPKDAKPEELDPVTRGQALVPMEDDHVDGDGNEEDGDHKENAVAHPPPQEAPEEVAPAKSTGHKLDDDTADKKKEVEWFADIEGAAIECDQSEPSKVTRVQIILIGGKREAVKVNLSTTVQEIYAHAKIASGYEGTFQLLGGFPPKPLINPESTVEDEGLRGSRITQREQKRR